MSVNDIIAEAKAYVAAQARVAEASRTREGLIPRVLELAATTPAGTLAKARVVLALFGNSGGRKSRAVASLVADLAAAQGVAGEEEGERGRQY